MKRRDIEAYLARDWRKVERLKDEHWRRRKLALGAGAALRAMDDLRVHAMRTVPGWPTKEDREEDLETHRRVSEALHRTAPVSCR